MTRSGNNWWKQKNCIFRHFPPVHHLHSSHLFLSVDHFKVVFSLFITFFDVMSPPLPLCMFHLYRCLCLSMQEPPGPSGPRPRAHQARASALLDLPWSSPPFQPGLGFAHAPKIRRQTHSDTDAESPGAKEQRVLRVSVGSATKKRLLLHAKDPSTRRT